MKKNGKKINSLYIVKQHVEFQGTHIMTQKPRRLSSMVLGFLLIFSALAVMNITSINVRAAPPETWDTDAERIIQNETRYRDDIVITVEDGDLTIKNNGTLIFNNSVTLKILCDVYGEYGIKIESGGKFIINSTNSDTEITYASSYPYIFTYQFLNSGTIDFLGATVERIYGDKNAKSTTGGIRNLVGSVCRLENCNIKDSDTHGIYFGPSSSIIQSYIKNTDITNTAINVLNGTGIWIEGKSIVLIDNVTIDDMKDDGLKIVNASNVTITSNTVISNSYGCGIYLQNSDNVMIQNGTVVQNGQADGIYLDGSKVGIKGTNIYNNKGNGIYCYNNSLMTVDNNTISSNDVCGIYLDKSSNNTITYNNISYSPNLIYLNLANDNNVTNNTLSSGQFYGIHLYNSIGNTIARNTIFENNDGIFLDNSNATNIIAYNNLSTNFYNGIHLNDSSNNNIKFNNASWNSKYGLYLDSSSCNAITNNSAYSNYQGGFVIYYSNSNTITNSTISSNSGYGIWLDCSISNTITATTMTEEGIVIGGESLHFWNTHTINTSNTVNGKPVHYWKNQTKGTVPAGAGEVILANCTGVTVENQNISVAGLYGICLGFSMNNTIGNNKIYLNCDSSCDIRLFNSNNNTIINNNVSSDANITYGISLCYSSNNTITNNNASMNTFYGIHLSVSQHNNITNNNIINNWRGIALVDDSDDNTITSNFISNNFLGIFIYNYSDETTINNNTASNNNFGFCLFLSTDNNIAGNNASSNNYSGIYIESSSNNIIANNDVSSNAYSGIMLLDSINTVIVNNTVSNNIGYYGFYSIDLTASSNIIIYHNIFINNTNQAYDDGANQWDNGYPSGGNYWDDYTGVDVYGGPGQNLSGMDGIGDSPYNIAGGGNAKDHYPIMSSEMLTYTYWAKAYGGSGADFGDSVQRILPTSDGGYVLAGRTTSYGAGGTDSWIMKIAANGSVVWQKTYGGTGDDHGNDIIQTADGGFAVAGYITVAGNGFDVWVFKLYSNGSMEWQKRFGNSSNDAAYSIQQTDDDSDGSYDNGYIVAGYTTAANGYKDYWILKLLSNGSCDWQKSYGGPYDDIARKIITTSQGSSFQKGYVVTGQTQSFGASNKDAWTLRLYANGSIYWDKRYGGSGNDYMESICEASDGGYVTVGCTATWGAGSYDAWAVKLNATGSIVWQKTYGGSNYEYAQAVQQTSDGGYIVAAYTATYGAGGEDIWLLKLESDGSIDWQKTYGGSGNEYPLSAVQLAENSYIVAGSTSSPAFVTGSTDCWILKLGYEGRITFDYNSGASVGITLVSAASSNSSISSTSVSPTTTVKSWANTSVSPSNTNCGKTTQATPSYGWY